MASPVFFVAEAEFRHWLANHETAPELLVAFLKEGHRQEEMIKLTGPLKIWTGAEGSSHFMSVPVQISGEIRAHAMMVRRGFGSLKVEATIDDVTWRTSVFPSKSSGGYFLPVKIEVCRKTGIVAGDEVTVELELL